MSKINVVNYYFDSNLGLDSNDGLSENYPKKSLEELNKVIAKIDFDCQINVKCGSYYSGTLLVKHCDNTSSLVVCSYGSGERPIFDGNGNESAIEVNRAYTTISNLEVTNKLGLIGIFVKIVTEGEIPSVNIENCYVHDVNWNCDYLIDVNKVDPESIDVCKICPNERFYYETGGILFFASGESKKPCYFKDVTVKGNVIERVSRSGIFFTGLWNRRPGTCWGLNPYYDDENGWYPSKNVKILENKVLSTGGDGIVLIGSVNSLIEKNVSYHSNYLGRKGHANAGIWPIGCKNVLIQYNEAGYSHLANGSADGEGFDIDIACENITFRYNYSHDNDGGAILLCNAKTTQPRFNKDGSPVMKDGVQEEYAEHGNWQNVTITNCLSVNNGKDWDNPEFIHFSSTCKKLTVKNNTVIMSGNKDGQLIIRSGDYACCGKQEDLLFTKNVFCSLNKINADYNMENAQSYVYEDNLYSLLGTKCTQTVNEKDAKFLDFNIEIPSLKNGLGVMEEIINKVNNLLNNDYGAKLN